MAFLTEKELIACGFKKIGENVKISNKASIYNYNLIEIGDNSRIDDFCTISGKVVIGKNVHIAVFCNLAGGTEGIFMEDFSGLAYGCHVMTQTDDYSGRSMTNPTVPSKYKKETKKSVYIKRHTIIGTGSIVLPGVSLNEGTSVGALSMVTKSTEEWSIYFGAPAKRIKSRKKDLLELEKAFLAETGN